MKKTVLFLIMTLLIVASAACGGGKPSDSGASSAPASSDSALAMPDYTITGDTVKLLCWSGQTQVTDPKGEFYKANKLMQEHYGCSIKIVRTTYEELPTKAAALVLSNDAPDLIFFKDQDYPVFIQQNIAAETSEYIDLKEPLYSGLKDTYKIFEYKGKQYFMPYTEIYTDSYIFFWKSFFEDAGIETPLEIYQNDPDDWTLSKLRELMKDVTVDADRDGVPEVYGLTIHPGEMYMCSGADFVTVDPQTGKYANNLRNPVFNTFMDFIYDTGSQGDNTRLMVYNHISDFAAKKAAMTWAQVWPFDLEETYYTGIASGEMGFVVTPRVDGTDKWYVKGRIDGFWMGAGCPNPGGAAAFIASNCFLNSDPATVAAAREEDKAEYGFTDAIFALRDEFNRNDLFAKTTFQAYGVGQWGNIYQYNLWSDVGLFTGSWAATVEKFYPILQAEIDTVNAQ